jgi:hypothetical protein
MATYLPHPESAQTLDATAVWRDRCFLTEGSLFNDEPLWTLQNFELLKQAFSDLVHGKATFYAKLAEQVQSQSPAVKKLAAECLWLLLIFAHHHGFRQQTKRQKIGDIWTLSGESLPNIDLLSDQNLYGIGSPGTAFLTRIPDEYRFLIGAMLAWKGLAASNKDALFNAADPWPFCRWLTEQPGGDRRIFRHILLFLLFPEHFERICSRDHKRQIFDVFSKRLPPSPALDSNPSNPCELDQALLQIRGALAEEYGKPEIDFYEPPWKEIWNPQDDKLTATTPNVETPARRFWIEKTLVKGRSDRETGANALGQSLWSPQRSTSGGDIYSAMRRIRPGDVVFHLTDNRALSGVSVARAEADTGFVGLADTDWAGQPAYRIPLDDYAPLEPALDRDSLFKAEPFRTQLAQLAANGSRGLFFNRKLELNQGAYLTEAPDALLGILNAAYQAQCGQNLPFFDGEAPLLQSLDEAVDLNDLFLEADEIEAILSLWRAKKNVILQGPPGVGKSFVAQKLAFALIGAVDRDRLEFVQFHQSYSYEDFVEGFRPTGNGFALRTGKFVNFCRKAAQDPERRYVFIIDEINRGNLSKILGELMLLIEPDKRDPKWQMQLAYGDQEFYVPENLYLLGLMNTADRSLAVVDYALRRRFAFLDLEPKLHSSRFTQHLGDRQVDGALQTKLLQRIALLNEEISTDLTNLGPGFAIGHSFFCGGPYDGETGDAWYRRVITTEILPLLREYWFDAPGKVESWKGQLLAE